jgi:phosphoglycolate phosphatase
VKKACLSSVGGGLFKNGINFMIIFDFDGTLADTHQLILKHYNAFVERHAWIKLTIADQQFQHSVRNMSMMQARKKLQVPLYKLLLIMPFIRRSLFGDYKTAMLFPGMEQVLEDFDALGISMGVLSSNNKKAIYKVLDQHINKMQFVMDKCIFSKGKKLNKIVKSSDASEVHTYVSDAASDIVAANQASMNTVAVSWGLHQASFLEAAKPDFIAHTPAELFEYLKNLHVPKAAIV